MDKQIVEVQSAKRSVITRISDKYLPHSMLIWNCEPRLLIPFKQAFFTNDVNYLHKLVGRTGMTNNTYMPPKS